LNQLEEIIDLGTDDTNRQSLVLGGNFQAKHAQQKQEVAHFRKGYYQDRVNWSWRRDEGPVDTAWNSRGVDEKLMQVRENANWKSEVWKDILSTGVFSSFGLAQAWINRSSLGRFSRIQGRQALDPTV
jgi:hypothetical protein